MVPGLPSPDAPDTASEDPRLTLLMPFLRRLLRGLAVAAVLYFAVGEPFLFVNKRGALVGGVVSVVLMLLIPGSLRRHGRVRAAAWTALLAGTLVAALWVVFSGGVRSPGCLLQLVLIQVATLLLGRRGALAVAIPTLTIDLACVVAARMGYLPPVMFPAPPLVAWSIFLAACIFLASPLEYFLACLGGALDDARREVGRRREVESALRECITERAQAEAALRDSEARYRRIVDTTNEGIWTIDEHTAATFVNRRMAEMLGYTPDEMTGRKLLSFMFPEDIPKMEERMAVLRRGGSYVGEMRYRRRDGRELIALASAAPNLDEAGRSRGGFAMMIDITAQKRDQAEHEVLRQQLEQSRKMESIGRLAGGVAHDFNNLLTVINGYSDMLLKDLPEDDPERTALMEIRDAGERAAALTKQLLTFGRRQISRPRALDLNALVAGAERMLQRLIGEDIVLETSLDPALEAVEADPGQMHQVLLNLSINARDAMPDGGTLVIATAAARFDQDSAPPGCQPGAYARLTVADTGAGMDEETMRHLFEPFFTTKPSGLGTGLGLATVYGVVQQSRGSIRVHSAPGEGCRFEIHLPCVAGPAEPIPPLTLEPPQPQRELTVLVAEDQDSVRRLASHALRACGHHVLEAASGAEALRLADAVQGGCQLVVTDVVMPGMSGKELAEALRARWPEIRVLFMSGYPNEVILRHGLMNAEVNYLEKPFTPSDLAAKVREVME